MAQAQVHNSHPVSSLPHPADTLRLLLVLGARCNLPDKEGCTPLHWAAIRGHTEACTVLLQARRGGPQGVAGAAGCRRRRRAEPPAHATLGDPCVDACCRRRR